MVSFPYLLSPKTTFPMALGPDDVGVVLRNLSIVSQEKTKMPNRNLVTATIALSIVIAVSLACGGGDPVPPAYQGNWVGSDGSTIYMHADGKAGFEMGGKSVDGGGAEIDESARTLTISLFGISNTWKIDQPPSGDTMILSGTRYSRN